MNIKKRIQELSLDQKAKLYFMGLVRQGKIDTLPEDPKAAYVSMMMDKDDYGRSISGKDKSTFMEPEDSMPAARARKMMGLEEGYNKIANKLYGVNYDKLSPQEQEYVRDTIDREPGGAFNPRLSGGLKEMASELGYLNENQPTFLDDESMDELLDIILKYVEDPDDAQAELDRFDDGGFDALSNMVAANLDRDPEYKAWYNKLQGVQDLEEIGMFHDPLGYEPEDMDNPDEDLVIIGSGYLDIKSNFGERPSMTNGEYAELGQKVVDQLHNGDKEAALDFIYSKINENINESKVDISYTDPGFRFYKMKVDGKRLDREEGTEYLKGLGIDMEIPRSYDESILDKIVAQLKEKGIDADHDAAMDVS